MTRSIFGWFLNPPPTHEQMDRLSALALREMRGRRDALTALSQLNAEHVVEKHGGYSSGTCDACRLVTAAFCFGETP